MNTPRQHQQMRTSEQAKNERCAWCGAEGAIFPPGDWAPQASMPKVEGYACGPELAAWSKLQRRGGRGMGGQKVTGLEPQSGQGHCHEAHNPK